MKRDGKVQQTSAVRWDRAWNKAPPKNVQRTVAASSTRPPVPRANTPGPRNDGNVKDEKEKPPMVKQEGRVPTDQVRQKQEICRDVFSQIGIGETEHLSQLQRSIDLLNSQLATKKSEHDRTRQIASDLSSARQAADKYEEQSRLLGGL